MEDVNDWSVTFDSDDLTERGWRYVAESFLSKGRSFLAAAVLLERQGGHRFVVLHLLCQGTEIILKSLLLFLDHKKYRKPCKKYRHDLNQVISASIEAFRLHPLRPALAKEVNTLNNIYMRHLLRYESVHDLLVSPASIESDRMLRRMAAVMRASRSANWQGSNDSRSILLVASPLWKADRQNAGSTKARVPLALH